MPGACPMRLLNLLICKFCLFLVCKSVFCADLFIQEVEEINQRARVIMQNPLANALIQNDDELKSFFEDRLEGFHFLRITSLMTRLYDGNNPELFTAIILKYPSVINKLIALQKSCHGVYAFELWKWMANLCSDSLNKNNQHKEKLFSYLMAMHAQDAKNKSCLSFMFGIKGCWIEHIKMSLDIDEEYKDCMPHINLEKLPNQFKLKLLAVIDAKENNFQKMAVVEECTICLSELMEQENKLQLHCGHSFHVECINEWFTKGHTCPNCRSEN